MNILKNAIEDLLNNRHLAVDEAVDRHFAPSFRQRTNGSWADRLPFLASIDDLRQVTKHATITVLDEFVDDQSYAERHVIDLVKHNGERIVQEVYVFAERDSSGRFTRIEETTVAHSDNQRPRVVPAVQQRTGS